MIQHVVSDRNATHAVCGVRVVKFYNQWHEWYEGIKKCEECYRYALLVQMNGEDVMDRLLYAITPHGRRWWLDYVIMHKVNLQMRNPKYVFDVPDLF